MVKGTPQRQAFSETGVMKELEERKVTSFQETIFCELGSIVSAPVSPTVYLVQGRMTGPTSTHTQSVPYTQGSSSQKGPSAGSLLTPSPPKEEA